MERVGDTLRVESQKAPHVWRSNCRVDFEIVVPSKIDVSLKSGSGDASIDGMQGRVSIRIGSGDVSVKGRILGVEARSGNGDIEVQGVVGDARIRMGSGKCELHYDEVPTRGTVEIRAGSGSATIHVPSSAKLQASLRAGSGRLYRDLPDTPDAEFKIAMRAGSGNLYLKRR